jgi:hypothetical protein
MTVVPPSETERNLQRLEGEIRRLETEYNMYFAGRLRTPPWDTRRRVDDLLKQFDRAYIPNYGERFRFSTLQARAAKLAELWDRGMRAREEGRGGPFVPRRPGLAPPAGQPAEVPDGASTASSSAAPGAAASAGASATSSPAGPASAGGASGVVHVAAFRDPAAEREKLRGLYDSFQQARDQVGERGQLPFDQFASLIENQVAKLQSGAGSEVAFRVKVEDGRVKVTAKAIKDGDER